MTILYNRYQSSVYKIIYYREDSNNIELIYLNQVVHTGRDSMNRKNKVLHSTPLNKNNRNSERRNVHATTPDLRCLWQTLLLTISAKLHNIIAKISTKTASLHVEDYTITT